MTCPRCGHRAIDACAESAADGAVATAAATCAACGVILAKARPRPQRPPALIERAAALLLEEDRDAAPSLIGRALLLGVLVILTWRFATASIASNTAGQSWLHLIDLVFHEAGHVLWLPFGQFMTALGGSLTQLLVPAVLAIAFLTRHRDPFGAAVSCWWLGENLVDLAPYIDDARSLQLVLLGGRTGAEVEGHDWERILMLLGWLRFDHTLARLAHAIGAIVMLLALAWGAALVAAQWRRMRASERAHAGR